MSHPDLACGSSNKAEVIVLQTALNANGERLSTDGDFGPGTENAVKSFQASYGLPQTGVADDKTWSMLTRSQFCADPAFATIPMAATTPLSGATGVGKAWNAYGYLVSALAPALGLVPSVVCAVLAVESAGAGFWNSRMVIRFENHVFRSRWGKDNLAVFDRHFKFDPNETWMGHAWRPDGGAWRPLHTKAAGQDEEWAVLAFARTLAQDAALQSISMGAPQIMGFNYARIGYPSALAMFNAFAVNERAHVLGLFDFIRADHHMVRALRANDWTGFARIYNGKGKEVAYGKDIGDNVVNAKRMGIA